LQPIPMFHALLDRSSSNMGTIGHLCQGPKPLPPPYPAAIAWWFFRCLQDTRKASEGFRVSHSRLCQPGHRTYLGITT
jgi:hypothetical protein